MSVRAAIFGCEGQELTADERAFFRDANPWGFILFQRNCGSPEQLRRLTSSLREAVGAKAPILIDQEGGRVQRLRGEHWKKRPAAASFGAISRQNPAAARGSPRDDDIAAAVHHQGRCPVFAVCHAVEEICPQRHARR